MVLVRLLVAVAFQPRLSVIAGTLSAAATDISYFIVILTVVGPGFVAHCLLPANGAALARRCHQSYAGPLPVPLLQPACSAGATSGTSATLCACACAQMGVLLTCAMHITFGPRFPPLSQMSIAMATMFQGVLIGASHGRSSTTY